MCLPRIRIAAISSCEYRYKRPARGCLLRLRDALSFNNLQLFIVGKGSWRGRGAASVVTLNCLGIGTVL